MVVVVGFSENAPKQRGCDDDDGGVDDDNCNDGNAHALLLNTNTILGDIRAGKCEAAYDYRREHSQRRTTSSSAQSMDRMQQINSSARRRRAKATQCVVVATYGSHLQRGRGRRMTCWRSVNASLDTNRSGFWVLFIWVFGVCNTNDDNTSEEKCEQRCERRVEGCKRKQKKQRGFFAKRIEGKMFKGRLYTCFRVLSCVVEFHVVLSAHS